MLLCLPLFILKAAGGQRDIMLELHRHQIGHPAYTSEPIIRACARNGQLETLKWIMSHPGAQKSRYVVEDAAYHGHFDIVQWATENGFAINTLSCPIKAVEAGNLDILKYLLDRGCVFHTILIHYAVASPNLELVKYVFERSKRADLENIYGSEVCRGGLAVLKWVLDQEESSKDFVEISRGAASLQKMDILKWLRDNNHLVTDEVVWRSAVRGDLKQVKWAIAEGFPWDREIVIAKSIKSRNLEILKWLVSEAPCRTDIRSFAKESIEYFASADNLEGLWWFVTERVTETEMWSPKALMNMKQSIDPRIQNLQRRIRRNNNNK